MPRSWNSYRTPLNCLERTWSTRYSRRSHIYFSWCLTTDTSKVDLRIQGPQKHTRTVRTTQYYYNLVECFYLLLEHLSTLSYFRRCRPVSSTSTYRTDCVQLQCGVPEVGSAARQLAQRRHHQLPGSHTRWCQLGRAEQRDGQCQYTHSAPDQPHVGCTV